MLKPAQASEAARLEVPSREPVERGEAVRIEISFGPLSDEVELDGRVEEIVTRPDGRPPLVVVVLAREHASRVRYVRQVLDGIRHASARAHRRVPVDMEVRWHCGRARHASRISDLSRGGAFILSREPPAVGSEVGVEIRISPHHRALSFSAVVSWVRGEGEDPGFGVSFRLQDRAAAAALTRVVKQHEQTLPIVR